MKDYYAHINGSRKQTVDEHLKNTAALAREFASAFNAGEFGYLAGISHDIGKFSDGFQKRLEGGPKVDHSSAGAFECAKIEQEFVGMCVAGHHSGLPDYGNNTDLQGENTFIGRIKKVLQTSIITYPGWEGPLPKIPCQPDFGCDVFACSLWIRMIFSSLVDADFLDTEKFMINGETERQKYESVDDLNCRLKKYVSKWDGAETDINRLRNRIRADCISAAEKEKGMFSLTVPTGGGKTISSLSFALEHARKHGMQRIIYVIPYTSIIEQNAAVFRDILGDDNVVEHHSEADFVYDENINCSQKKISLAAENWDAPIIVTTAVQFFESLYSNKPSKCRKLHNIANSVIIFDEAQSIPIFHLTPCMAVIGTLVKHFGVSAVLCSATQPFVSDILQIFAPEYNIHEICNDVEGIFNALERVNYRQKRFDSLNELAMEVYRSNQILCVVNTRKTAKQLFDLIPGEGKFHLSTLMMPDHRKRILSEITSRLKNGQVCRVISTSLIEAGVDIDFPTVYREMTGLDSIVQAAGRCNREGKRDAVKSIVTVFSLGGPVPPMLRANVGATKEAIEETGEIGSKKSIDQYFLFYRSLVGSENTDRTNSVKYLCKGIAGCLLPFKTVAENFHFINSNTRTVYIKTEESIPLIEEIKSGTANRYTFRKAGRFSVNIFENHYRSLYESGDIEEIDSSVAVLNNNELYDCQTGLSLSADNGRAEFI